MTKYAIGLDFGTNSCRSLIVNVNDGSELASHVFPYPTGEAGIITDAGDPNLARQNPADYLEGIRISIKNSLQAAVEINSGFSARNRFSGVVFKWPIYPVCL